MITTYGIIRKFDNEVIAANYNFIFNFPDFTRFVALYKVDSSIFPKKITLTN